MSKKNIGIILGIIVLIIIVAVQGYLLWNLTQEKNGNNKENNHKIKDFFD